MSSPSAASIKRKRSFSQQQQQQQQQHQPSTNTPSTELLQPSSRDASGEDGEDSTSSQPSPNTHKQPQPQPTDTASNVNVPPSKRVRKTPGDGHSHTHASNGTVDQSSISRKDPGEPSETTDGSDDVVAKQQSRGRPGLQIKPPVGPVAEDDVDVDVDGEKQQQQQQQEERKIQPPVIGRLQDPVGYRTNPPPVGRPVRVYADGVFDLFHLGHMRQLEQAKKAFPEVHLIVGVTGDGDTHERKGLTVLSGAERAETVRHCKWVDEVIPNCPWVMSPEFLDEHRIDYVAHDDLPYEAAEGDDIYAPIKARGKFLVTQRTEGVSTTGVITRIVRDYDQYISRQFKRGASRQELNVSWLKKNELEIRRHVTELRDNIRNNWTTTGQELGRELRQLWQNSRPNSPAPSARNSIDGNARGGMTSPTANKSHLSRVEGSYRPESPAGPGRNEDFATGYSLGLIGGVRAWMMRSRRSLFETSRPQSPSDIEEEGHESDAHNGNDHGAAPVSAEIETRTDANTDSRQT